MYASGGICLFLLVKNSGFKIISIYPEYAYIANAYSES